MGNPLNVGARYPAGKLAQGPAPGPETMLWGSSEFCPSSGRSPVRQQKSIQNLCHATPGSAGLDLSSSTYAVLTPEMGVQALSTGVYGPLPLNTIGLVIGRSSCTVKGLHVAPGIIDADYDREIKVMAQSLGGIIVIHQGQRLAHLILLPLVSTNNPSKADKRGTWGFGLSDAYCIQDIRPQRPELMLEINGRKFKGLLDTGADVSVITASQWPSQWPKNASMMYLQDIGQSQNPEQSSDELRWKDAEGHQGTFKPYIVPGLPVNLCGRDVMTNIGVYLYSPNDVVTQQMLDQGLLPRHGLGPRGEGIRSPLMPQLSKERKCSGNF